MMHGRMNSDTIESRGNALLGALPPEDKGLIATGLRRHELAGGAILLDPAQPFDRVYFPETAVIGLCAETAAGQPMGVGLVGREAMVGWEVLLGGDAPALTAVTLLQGGTILSLPVATLRRACDASATLTSALLRSVGALMQQLGAAVVSTASDPAERRLARWLLMLHDRIDGDELAIKHGELGVMLNLRRATITDCLHILEGERALRCTRGRITVRDRAVLERFAALFQGTEDGRGARSTRSGPPSGGTNLLLGFQA
ncbi:MAG: CarD family transcriptional regulator [Sphingobium sp.]|nr:CarD family transcriptional regulator [Sphingobium sp.]